LVAGEFISTLAKPEDFSHSLAVEPTRALSGARGSPLALDDGRTMRRITLILLLALLALPVYLETLLILNAATALARQGAARAQSDMEVHFLVEFYGTGAAVLSLLGLHFCSRAGLAGRHPLHVGFVATTLLPFVIYAVFVFL
jgi:hypothetical protein